MQDAPSKGPEDVIAIFDISKAPFVPLEASFQENL